MRDLLSNYPPGGSYGAPLGPVLDPADTTSRMLPLGLRTIIALVVSVSILAGGCSRDRASRAEATAPETPLLCYADELLAPVVQELLLGYEGGELVTVDYDDGYELYKSVSESRAGDVFVSPDPYVAGLEKLRLVEEAWTIGRLEPVITVARGNPHEVTGLQDFVHPDVSVYLPDFALSTIGMVAHRAVQNAGITEDLRARMIAQSEEGTPPDSPVAADVSIAWNLYAGLNSDTLEGIAIPAAEAPRDGVDSVTTATYGELDLSYVRARVAVLSSSKNLDAATTLAEYLASPGSAAVWQAYGLADTAASAAASGGEILVHCAGGMRGPIEKLAREFEAATGIAVELSYGGTNKLLGQIKLTQKGDVYIAGDADYIEMAAAEGLVHRSATLCYFVPVIIVERGNPFGIETVGDILESGARIGQTDPTATALGRLTPRILSLHGIDFADEWSPKVSLSTGTVNEIGVALTLGTIDAALVWRSEALNYRDAADFVEIAPQRNVTPAVGAAALTCAENAGGADAFLEFLTSTEGRRRLEQDGYTVEHPGAAQP